MIRKYLFLLICFFLGWSLLVVGQDKSILTADLIAESVKDAPISHIISLETQINKNGDLNLYLADVRSSSVIIMGKQGEELKISGKIGQNGRGPGEFLSVDNLQIYSGHNLLVYDRKIGRVSVFDLKTETLSRVFNISVEGGKYFPIKFNVLNNKKLKYYAPSKRFFQASDDFGEQRHVLLQQFNTEGFLLKDSLLIKPASDAFVVQKGGTMAVNPQPVFGNKSIFRFNDGMIYYGFTGNTTIEIYNTAAKLLRKVKLGLNSLEVTDNDIELALEKEALMLQEKKQVIRKNFLNQVPEYWPYYQNYVIDGKSRLWVGLSNHLDEDQRIWQVFSPKGKLVMEIKLPARFNVFQVKKDYIIGELFDRKFRSFIQIYKI